jgi:hypothetical protein
MARENQAMVSFRIPDVQNIKVGKYKKANIAGILILLLYLIKVLTIIQEPKKLKREK